MNFQKTTLSTFATATQSLIISTILLGYVYASTLINVFDYSDSFYHYLDLTCQDHPQWLYMLMIGRPIYNFISCPVWSQFIPTPADAYKARLIGLTILILCATYVSRLTTRRGVNFGISTLLACAMFALPGYLVFVNATSDFANIFTLPAVIGAFHFTLKVTQSAKSKFLVVGYLILSAALLLIAMLIYQQLTPIFFVLIAIVIILNPSKYESRRLLLGGICAFALAGLLYLVLHKVVLIPFVESIMHSSINTMYPDDTYEMSIKFSPILSLFHLLGNSPRVFSLWFMNLAEPLWLLFLIIFLFSITLFVVGESNPIYLSYYLFERVIYLITLIVLVNTTTLLTAEPSAPQRHCIPYMSFIVVVIVLQMHVAQQRFTWLKKLSATITFLLIFLLGSGLGYSSWNLKRNLVDPNTEEYAFVMQAVQAYDTTVRPRICFILSKRENLGGYLSNTADIKNEFGRTTSMLFGTSIILPIVAAKSMGIPTEILDVDRITSDTFNIPSNCELVIDMRIFQKQFATSHRLDLSD